MIITPTVLQQIKESCDLSEVVSHYIPLNRHLKALCPFHQEKTPSFSLHRQKQIWHCFGCHASGDAIAFVQKIEGISFNQAVVKLAAMVGVPLPKSEKFQSFINRRFERIKKQLLKIVYLRDVLKDYEKMRYAELRNEWRGLLLRPDKDRWEYLWMDMIEFHLFDQLNAFIKKIEDIIDEIEKEVRCGKFL